MTNIDKDIKNIANYDHEVKAWGRVSGLGIMFAREYKQKLIVTNYKKSGTIICLLDDITGKWNVVQLKQVLGIISEFVEQFIDEKINELRYVLDKGTKHDHIIGGNLLSLEQYKKDIMTHHCIKEIWSSCNNQLFVGGFKKYVGYDTSYDEDESDSDDE